MRMTTSIPTVAHEQALSPPFDHHHRYRQFPSHRETPINNTNTNGTHHHNTNHTNHDNHDDDGDDDEDDLDSSTRFYHNHAVLNSNVHHDEEQQFGNREEQDSEDSGDGGETIVRTGLYNAEEEDEDDADLESGFVGRGNGTPTAVGNSSDNNDDNATRSHVAVTPSSVKRGRGRPPKRDSHTEKGGKPSEVRMRETSYHGDFDSAIDKDATETEESSEEERSAEAERRRSQLEEKRAKAKQLKQKKAREVVEQGEVELPLSIGAILKLVALGRVDSDRPAYHNERYIFPIGYRSERCYSSYRDPDTKTMYICEILDGGSSPIFKITPADDPDNFVTSNTPTGAWTIIIKRVQDAKERLGTQRKFTTVSGPEYFGLSNPKIQVLIEKLPNVDKCKNYTIKMLPGIVSTNATETSPAIASTSRGLASGVKRPRDDDDDDDNNNNDNSDEVTSPIAESRPKRSTRSRKSVLEMLKSDLDYIEESLPKRPRNTTVKKPQITITEEADSESDTDDDDDDEYHEEEEDDDEEEDDNDYFA